MNLARAFEQKQQLEENWINLWSNTRTTPTSSILRITKAASTLQNSSLGSVLSPFIKRLSHLEMAKQRAKGICYNYDEPYSSRHQCKKLFWLEMDDSEEAMRQRDYG